MHFRAVKALALAVPFLILGTGVAEGQARFGPMVGVNLSTIGGDDVSDGEVSSKLGFLFGAFAQFDVSPRVAIQPQLLYTMKGTQDADDSDFKLKIDYIQIPVLAQIRFGGGSNVTPYLILGPSLAFKVSCKFTDGSTDVDCEDDLLEVSSTDFGAIGGLGLEIGNNVTVAARYDYSFSKLASDFDARNRAITFTIGYGVRLSPAM